jgi:hypothetical protein
MENTREQIKKRVDYQKFMEKEFPNYDKNYNDLCSECKTPISPKQKLINGLCKKCE